MAKEETKKEKTTEKKERVEEKKVITCVYKVNLHCPKCAHDIRKPLLRTSGVQSVDVKFEKNEITVKGAIDEKKIHKRIENLSKKKAEILPPPPAKVKETVGNDAKKTKKETVHLTTIKVFMHCSKCEDDLRRKLLKNKGIHNVKTDKKAQTIEIEGTIESEKLLTYMKKRVHKHAEIVPPKEDKDGKKQKDKEKDKEKENTVAIESTKITKIVEFKEEKEVEAKTPDGNVPYFIHYVYAPQMFSDENPNACCVM